MAAADPGLLTTACALDGMQVRTAGGVHLGRLFDVRVRTGGRGAPALTAIVYGRRGLFERLGLRHARPTSVPWSRVRSIEGRVIVVDDAPRLRSA